MPEVKPALETFAKILVVGIGGAGSSAVDRMVQAKIRGVEFVALNTDMQAIHHSLAPNKINIGKTVTKGLGSGMDPELGRRAAEESQNEIREMLKGANMVFLTAGLGGGTGSGAAPIVADVAREMGALTVAVVTKPFSFEGSQRKEIAERALEELAGRVDTIITIPNDRVMQMIDKKTSLQDAFRIIDDVLRQAVQGISELITAHGMINVDFADVRSIMAGQGSALMGIGRATGENRATEAAKGAISSPLLEMAIDGAQGILFIVAGSENLGMQEVQEAAKVITGSADANARIIFGVVTDTTLGDELKITVVATGFSNKSEHPREEKESNSNPFRPISRPVFGGQPLGGARVADKEAILPTRVSPLVARPVVREKEEETSPMMGWQKKSLGVNANISVNEEAHEEEDMEIPAFIRKKMNPGN